MNNNQKIKAIDALLPQTQCELCTHPGCKPYATAIVENNESIDLCLPGSIETLDKIGALLRCETQSMHASMRERAKPPMMAVVREDECIGCTKCIQACPVDAIIGAAKLMHVVITDACNGCELCVPPCPVDCIDMIELPKRTSLEKTKMANQSRDRFEKRNVRLARDQKQKRKKHLKAKSANNQMQTMDARKAAIRAAIERVKKNRSISTSDRT